MNTTSFDIETSDLDPFKGIIVSKQWHNTHETAYIDINEMKEMAKDNMSECSEYWTGTNYIMNELRNPNVKIILQNAKFEWEWMYVKYGVEITNFEDTMLLSFILDRGVPFQYDIDNPRKLKSVKLKALAKHYLNADTKEDDFFEAAGTKNDPGILRAVRVLFLGHDFVEEFKGKRKALEKFGVLNKEILRKLFVSYAKKDVEFTLALWEQIKDHSGIEAYRNALKAIPYMIKMKHRGLKTNHQYLIELQNKHNLIAKQKEQEIFQLAGKKFDINSNKQLPTIFEKQGVSLPLTKKGNPSTNKEVLKKINTPLTQALLEYRKAFKTGGTFLKGLLEDMDSNDVVHPNYNMCGTVHGRYSSSEEERT
jgi:DNA polymerase-1